jgi:O-antigen/teichoic acid export membrane protein
VTDRAELRALAIRGARWSVVDKWGVKLFSLATFAVLAYVLEPAAFGIVASAQVVVTLVQTITDQGVAQVLIVQREDDAATRSTAFWLSMASGLLGAGALFASAPLVALMFDQEELTDVLRVLSAFLILRALSAVPHALAQRDMRFRLVAARSIAAAVLSSAVGVTMALLGFGVWALVTQILAQAAVGAILLWVATRFRPGLQFSFPVARRIMRFGWKVVCIDVLTVVVSQGDNFVVGLLLGPVALGYYVIAFRLLNVLIEAFTGVMSQLSLPVFARLRDDRAGTINALIQATRTSLAVTVPLFGTLAITAPLVVPLMFGPKWDPSAEMLQVLCLAGVLSSITYFDRGVLFAADRAGLEIAVVGAMAAGTVAAASIGAQISLFAVAVAVTVRMVLTLPIRLVALRTAVGLDWRSYLAAWRAPAVAGLAMLATATGTHALLGASSAHLSVSLAATVGLLTYLAALTGMDRPLVLACLQLARPTQVPRRQK